MQIIPLVNLRKMNVKLHGYCTREEGERCSLCSLDVADWGILESAKIMR